MGYLGPRIFTSLSGDGAPCCCCKPPLSSRLIVPTLCVGMPQVTLCVTLWDAERPGLHSHAERGNDQLQTLQLRHQITQPIDLLCTDLIGRQPVDILGQLHHRAAFEHRPQRHIPLQGFLHPRSNLRGQQ